ncbi:transporter substrate-binding domain-containing protein [Pigmentibacter sp. JX0631]|uniref:substrate-binding periplasmic protein n=1 Tax=Pigmentibacter sp. JX0631 TaxID=2976982 RepID=UPI0024697519|nr:transporter substrate-binding domain-containing protein [Pigmentibacter sp. JX0631]WGL58694.1 transporter substrate-binding domain-containing protein [Pigmentibacter sp. JX0631]
MKRIFIFIISLIFCMNIEGAEKKIKLATLAWEPYIGPELEKNGPVAEIIRQALKFEGYQLELVFMPWARAMAESEKASDGIDGCMPKYYDESIGNIFEFSEPFFESHVGFIGNKKNNKEINYIYDKDDLNKTYDKLNNLSFGIVRGYFNEEKFDKRNDLKKIDVTTDEMNMSNLINKKVDLIFIDNFVFKYLLRKNYKLNISPADFTMLNPPIKVHKLYIIFSKKAVDYKEKLKSFNLGMKKLSKEKKLGKIIREFEDFR